MAKRKYTKTAEKPLSEVIAGRKEHYLGLMEQSLTSFQGRMEESTAKLMNSMSRALDEAYDSRNLEQIEQLEQVITLLSRPTTGKLEETAETSYEPNVDRRPRLTRYRFRKARDRGMTNEGIKAKYRMDSPQQISGFTMQWNKSKADLRKN